MKTIYEAAKELDITRKAIYYHIQKGNIYFDYHEEGLRRVLIVDIDDLKKVINFNWSKSRKSGLKNKKTA